MSLGVQTLKKFRVTWRGWRIKHRHDGILRKRNQFEIRTCPRCGQRMEWGYHEHLCAKCGWDEFVDPIGRWIWM